MDLLPSLTTVLIQESQRFNGLSDVIRKSLKDLIDAIQGLASMSQTLDSMYQSLLNNRVPLLWEESAYPSLKPLASWIRDFKARILFMSNWILNGNPPAYWLSGLFYP
jgi:dynein heavy chain